MTALGPSAPPDDAKLRNRRRWIGVGTVLWALLPLLTCGFGAPIAFSVALSRRRDALTIASLVAYSVLLLVGCGVIAAHDYPPPQWGEVVFNTVIIICSFGATAHLLVIRSTVWAAPAGPQVPVARLSSMEVVDRARKLREQARRTAEADPMLAIRLGIGRPDVPRQFDDGGLVVLCQGAGPLCEGPRPLRCLAGRWGWWWLHSQQCPMSAIRWVWIAAAMR